MNNSGISKTISQNELWTHPIFAKITAGLLRSVVHSRLVFHVRYVGMKKIALDHHRYSAASILRL